MADSLVLSRWKERWEKNNIPWHKEENNIYLMKYADKLLNKATPVKIFFPMCGKCVDMKWFYDLGHEVIGVEYCEQPIREFFAEQGLQYKTKTVEKLNCTLFKTIDNKIKLFCCDIFLFDKDCAGLMDAVWDRGGLCAVEKEDRKRYVKLLLSLLKPKFCYLLYLLIYNDWFYSGSPKSVPDELVHFLYDSSCSVKQLEKVKREKFPEELGVNHVEEAIWFITEKE